MCLFTINISSLVHDLFRYFVHFLIEVFISLMLSFKSYLDILCNNPLLGRLHTHTKKKIFANIFSQTVACLFIL